MLIIIGFVVGTIVVGKSMIDNSRIRKLYSDLSEYDSMVIMFKGKYGYLPGDYPDAVETLGASTIDGDASGDINAWPKDATVWETCLAWEHLSLSGIYPRELRCNIRAYQSDPALSVPVAPFNAGVALTYHPSVYTGPSSPPPPGVVTDYKHGFWVNSLTNFIALNGDGILTNWQMQQFDTKYDDGNAWTGHILARRSGTGSGFNCVGNGGQYNNALDSGETSCILFYLIEK